MSSSRHQSATETVDLMICSDEELGRLHVTRDSQYFCDVCQSQDVHLCDVDSSTACDIFSLHESLFPLKIRKTGLNTTYYFIIRNCALPSGRNNGSHLEQLRVVLDFSYSNSDGSQLSCEISMFPQFYLALCAIWVGTAVVWVALLVCRWRESVAFQQGITVVPVIQSIRAFVTHVLWKENQLTGEQNNLLVFLGYTFNAFFRSSLSTALLMLSKGFMILYWETSVVDRRRMLSCLSICMLSMVVSSFAYDILGGLFVGMLILVVRE